MKTFDAEKAADQLVGFIRDSVAYARYDKAIIGMSGGIDSTTSAILAVQALGVHGVYPILLPCGALSDEGTDDARLAIEWLKIPEQNVRLVDIAPMTDAAVVTLDSPMDKGRRGNIMARMRMVVLYDFAKSRRALVVGTENKTEHLLGYYTRFGDEASDIEPLRNVYKTQVYELAAFLGVPKKIIKKEPTAELWEGQTDERELGFTYKQADEILYFYFEEGVSRIELEARFGLALIERVWWWIEKGSSKDRLPVLR